MKYFLYFTVSVLALTTWGGAGGLPKVFAEGEPRVYFRTPAERLAPGAEITVAVLVESERLVNVFDIELQYPPAELEFLNFNAHASLIDFWRGEPEVLSPGTLRLVGGSIKGFRGRDGELIKLNFTARREGQASLSFSKAAFYSADGKGTLIAATPVPLILDISSQAPLFAFDRAGEEDTTPPVIVEASAFRNPDENAYLAIFLVKDSGSGLRATYLRARQRFAWKPWEKVASPVLLPKGSWAYELKAVDHQGNAVERVVYIREIMTRKILTGLFLVLLGFGGAYLLLKFLFRRI